MADPERQRARRTALDLLARREHTRLELYNKLLQRGYAGELSAALLDALEQQGLLSEQRFAESFVHARVRKGQGPRRLQAELRQRGVDAATIEAALAAEEVDWAELAGRVRERRFGAATPETYAERARQVRFLQYRGFTTEQIQAALADAHSA